MRMMNTIDFAVVVIGRSGFELGWDKVVVEIVSIFLNI